MLTILLGFTSMFILHAISILLLSRALHKQYEGIKDYGTAISTQLDNRLARYGGRTKW